MAPSTKDIQKYWLNGRAPPPINRRLKAYNPTQLELARSILEDFKDHQRFRPKADMELIDAFMRSMWYTTIKFLPNDHETTPDKVFSGNKRAHVLQIKEILKMWERLAREVTDPSEGDCPDEGPFTLLLRVVAGKGDLKTLKWSSEQDLFPPLLTWLKGPYALPEFRTLGVIQRRATDPRAQMTPAHAKLHLSTCGIPKMWATYIQTERKEARPTDIKFAFTNPRYEPLHPVQEDDKKIYRALTDNRLFDDLSYAKHGRDELGVLETDETSKHLDLYKAILEATKEHKSSKETHASAEEISDVTTARREIDVRFQQKEHHAYFAAVTRDLAWDWFRYKKGFWYPDRHLVVFNLHNWVVCARCWRCDALFQFDLATDQARKEREEEKENVAGGGGGVPFGHDAFKACAEVRLHYQAFAALDEQERRMFA